MLKFQAEITDMLVFGRNYCCSCMVHSLPDFNSNVKGILKVVLGLMNATGSNNKNLQIGKDISSLHCWFWQIYSQVEVAKLWISLDDLIWPRTN